MATQRVTFEGASGDQLAARVDLPVEGTPRAWALFAHCFTCSKNLNAVVNVARSLNLEGIAVLRFDFTGLGESEGDFADTNFSSNIEDLVAAASYMEAEWGPPEILIGHSLGGAAVLHAAHQVPSCRAVVTIGAPSDPAHVLQHMEDSFDEIEAEGMATVHLAGRPFKVKQQFVEDIREARMKEVVRDLDRALLILHSPVDEVVSIDHAGTLFTMARHPRSFIALDGADHLLTDQRDSRYAARAIAGWVGRYVEIRDDPESGEGTQHARVAASEGVGQGEEPSTDPPTGDHASDEESPVEDKAKGDQVMVRTGESGFQTEIRARQHHLLADEPASVGGEDQGPTPYELLAAALGTCTTMTVRMYADRKGWPVKEVRTSLRHEKRRDGDDPRVDYISREVTVEGPLSDGQRARLVEIASRCPVHRTLEAGVRIGTIRKDPEAPAEGEG
ncbi:MAG: OsmC family protein [Gemmatimonadales bacterium]|nr:MAG: OsmC family protein [Gemmatimonadales bacterium]